MKEKHFAYLSRRNISSQTLFFLILFTYSTLSILILIYCNKGSWTSNVITRRGKRMSSHENIPEKITNLDQKVKRSFKFYNGIQNNHLKNRCQGLIALAKKSRTIVKDYLKPTYLAEQIDVTLLTQLSYSRWHMVDYILKTWDGPVSLALYIKPQEIPLLDRNLKQLRKCRCNIAVHLVINDNPSDLYPTNFLRNVALNQSSTSHVLLSDVDFTPAYGSYGYLKLLASLWPQDQVAFVLAAFEFLKNNTHFPKNKTDLLHEWRNNNIQPFHKKWPPGQAPTEYQKWIAFSHSYEIDYKELYEPYLVMRREEVPEYNEFFLGRHRNKVSLCMHVHLMGFKMVVIPDIFLIHNLHEETVRPSGPAQTLHKRCMTILYDEMKRELEKKSGKKLLLPQESFNNISLM